MSYLIWNSLFFRSTYQPKIGREGGILVVSGRKCPPTPFPPSLISMLPNKGKLIFLSIWKIFIHASAFECKSCLMKCLKLDLNLFFFSWIKSCNLFSLTDSSSNNSTTTKSAAYGVSHFGGSGLATFFVAVFISALQAW